MYKLRSRLIGHELDVRGVATISETLVVSASRDGTGRLWDLTYPLDTVSNSVICYLSPAGEFINSVAYVTMPEHPLVAFGGKDAIVHLCAPNESFTKPGDEGGMYQLVGHTGNVCSLDHRGSQLISGSWDCTAKVWDLHSFSAKYDLVGHSAAVWDARIVSTQEEVYLTCSADKTIKKWCRGAVQATFTGHNDVVRKLLVLPGGRQFVSASNDGTLKIWDLASGAVVHTLVGHTSFVYDIAVTSQGDIVSTAEDRTVHIWRNGTIAQVITLPCLSAWCVTVLPNDDIAVGGSGKEIYVFTTEKDRFATEQGLVNFAELVGLSTISEQSIDNLKKTDLPGYDRLSSPGKEEGAVVMVKSPTGAIEAHQWSAGEWVKIGDVVGSAGGSSDKKEYNGASYDYVFDVDIEDGKPPLKLPYNVSENPYVAADRFLAANDLPLSYTDEVVRFLLENTKGFSLGQEPAPSAPDAAAAVPAHSAYDATLDKSLSAMFPQTVFIKFVDFKLGLLFKGFEKFNLAQKLEVAFDEDNVNRVKRALDKLTSVEASYLIRSVIPRVVGKWEKSTQLVGYDFLRICIPRITIADILNSTKCAEALLLSILECLADVEENDLTLVMMIAKVLCNLTTSPLFAQMFLTVADDGKVTLNEYFESLGQKLVVAVKAFASSSVSHSHKHFAPAMSAIASVLYDLLAYLFTNRTLGAEKNSLKSISVLLDDLAEDLVSANDECAYRLCVTLGNLLAAHVTNELPAWYKVAQDRYTDARFQSVYREVETLLKS